MSEENTTLKISKGTKDRLYSYKEYPKQTSNELIIAILDCLDEYATKLSRLGQSK